MEQLTALDAGFLEAEDSDSHVSLAVGAVSIMEGPAPSHDEFLSAIADRMPAIQRFRQMLRTHPLDLRPPEWVDDPHFQVSRHVHRVALPHPGGDTELFEVVATLMERRLDRERPLWDCWIIEGLTGNRWAVLTKIHHCIADGIAATQLMAKFGDDDTSDSFVTKIYAAQQAARQAPGLHEPSLNPFHWVGEVGRSVIGAATAAEHVAVGAVELAASLLRPAPESSLNGPVTTMRRYSAARVRLADMQKISEEFGVTLNDVALAAITGGYRAILLERGERPGPSSLRTLIPVSVRPVEKFSVADNRVSAMLPLLPVDEEDPVQQLRLVHERLTHAKASGQSEGGSAVVSAVKRVPFALSAWTVRLLMRLPQRAVVALATNVPGPRGQQTLMGRRVLEVLPIPPIALQLRTGIAMLTYADQFVFGITADYDTAPDIEALAAGVENGVARLLTASRTHRRKRAPKARRPNARSAM
ncbi:WS/DGAT/MGAT family O-acyltransferase [Mycobacterium intracellulare]|uniref:Diacylglycerol O-acyltransferase n=1 Tax=Mycobacterium intracellulare subsp. chimaera TaxID=222805 RepID=A0A7U5MKM6_MYCIT|nr:wax ester/triacylglycerol synthase family O-acyltransferase [Mycobacterium intracellulare]ASL15171.1 acyltransferase, WS/DGAT/MGAT [Mycobacterium intracellulare subsp. chimaera]ASQ86354.1 wax ester/triacylglycerol synthase family O-acyltransferase [Mycobacterium intracellulare subsp. chimaera]MCF1815337.1 wax ester/triacylglycerol synthase family O-acyltransferase [Mycobacterium intracellulare subsp. intracellulare]MDM3929451.1 wax ester/triacylglycerol synthase family O-acyltransferase [Myc